MSDIDDEFDRLMVDLAIDDPTEADKHRRGNDEKFSKLPTLKHAKTHAGSTRPPPLPRNILVNRPPPPEAMPSGDRHGDGVPVPEVTKPQPAETSVLEPKPKGVGPSPRIDVSTRPTTRTRKPWMRLTPRVDEEKVPHTNLESGPDSDKVGELRDKVKRLEDTIENQKGKIEKLENDGRETYDRFEEMKSAVEAINLTGTADDIAKNLGRKGVPDSLARAYTKFVNDVNRRIAGLVAEHEHTVAGLQAELDKKGETPRKDDKPDPIRVEERKEMAEMRVVVDTQRAEIDGATEVIDDMMGKAALQEERIQIMQDVNDNAKITITKLEKENLELKEELAGAAEGADVHMVQFNVVERDLEAANAQIHRLENTITVHGNEDTERAHNEATRGSNTLELMNGKHVYLDEVFGNEFIRVFGDVPITNVQLLKQWWDSGHSVDHTNEATQELLPHYQEIATKCVLVKEIGDAIYAAAPGDAVVRAAHVSAIMDFLRRWIAAGPQGVVSRECVVYNAHTHIPVFLTRSRQGVDTTNARLAMAFPPGGAAVPNAPLDVSFREVYDTIRLGMAARGAVKVTDAEHVNDTKVLERLDLYEYMWELVRDVLFKPDNEILAPPSENAVFRARGLVEQAVGYGGVAALLERDAAHDFAGATEELQNALSGIANQITDIGVAHANTIAAMELVLVEVVQYRIEGYLTELDGDVEMKDDGAAQVNRLVTAMEGAELTMANMFSVVRGVMATLGRPRNGRPLPHVSTTVELLQTTLRNAQLRAGHDGLYKQRNALLDEFERVVERGLTMTSQLDQLVDNLGQVQRRATQAGEYATAFETARQNVDRFLAATTGHLLVGGTIAQIKHRVEAEHQEMVGVALEFEQEFDPENPPTIQDYVREAQGEANRREVRGMPGVIQSLQKIADIQDKTHEALRIANQLSRGPGLRSLAEPHNVGWGANSAHYDRLSHLLTEYAGSQGPRVRWEAFLAKLDGIDSMDRLRISEKQALEFTKALSERATLYQAFGLLVSVVTTNVSDGIAQHALSLFKPQFAETLARVPVPGVVQDILYAHPDETENIRTFLMDAETLRRDPRLGASDTAPKLRARLEHMFGAAGSITRDTAMNIKNSAKAYGQALAKLADKALDAYEVLELYQTELGVAEYSIRNVDEAVRVSSELVELSTGSARNAYQFALALYVEGEHVVMRPAVNDNDNDNNDNDNDNEDEDEDGRGDDARPGPDLQETIDLVHDSLPIVVEKIRAARKAMRGRANGILSEISEPVEEIENSLVANVRRLMAELGRVDTRSMRSVGNTLPLLEAGYGKEVSTFRDGIVKIKAAWDLRAKRFAQSIADLARTVGVSTGLSDEGKLRFVISVLERIAHALERIRDPGSPPSTLYDILDLLSRKVSYFVHANDGGDKAARRALIMSGEYEIATAAEFVAMQRAGVMGDRRALGQLVMAPMIGTGARLYVDPHSGFDKVTQLFYFLRQCAGLVILGKDEAFFNERELHAVSMVSPLVHTSANYKGEERDNDMYGALTANATNIIDAEIDRAEDHQLEAMLQAVRSKLVRSFSVARLLEVANYVVIVRGVNATTEHGDVDEGEGVQGEADEEAFANTLLYTAPRARAMRPLGFMEDFPFFHAFVSTVCTNRALATLHRAWLRYTRTHKTTFYNVVMSADKSLRTKLAHVVSLEWNTQPTDRNQAVIDQQILAHANAT